MNFESALSGLKSGNAVTRTGWNGKGMFISIQLPEPDSKMTRPYIYMTIPARTTNQFNNKESEQLVPWLASQTDLLAEDWSLIS